MILTPVQELACSLIAKPSVTPNDCGCQDLLKDTLAAHNFKCLSLKDSGTVNLLALHGCGNPFLLFLGHTDVVPPGDVGAWNHPPFQPHIDEIKGEKRLYGRGAADMKGSDAAMTCALCRYASSHPCHLGTIGLLVTSNEEGDAKGGTPFVADYLKQHNLIPNYCIVGEPSSAARFGDQIKNGRRGSLTAHIEIFGVQGHVAYPQNCDNAAHKAGKLIAKLSEEIWDSGNDSFPPTSFQVTNVNCGTGAENVVPGSCHIMCNWRFGNLQSKDSISLRFNEICNGLGIKSSVRWVLNGLPFVTAPNSRLIEALNESIASCCGLKASLSTSGGTSDGRFIAPLGAQVVEFGPIAATIHKVNEFVDLDDLNLLEQIYFNAMDRILNG